MISSFSSIETKSKRHILLSYKGIQPSKSQDSEHFA